MAGASDAVVIGSGPNGLVAAALLARAGWRVTVLEAQAVAGGAVRSEPLTRPGFVHDTCSAFYGVLHESPVFGELELDRRVRWAGFEIPVAAATDPEEAGLCYAEQDATCAHLERLAPGDGAAWGELCRWWDETGRRVMAAGLQPLPSPLRYAALVARLGARGALRLAQDFVSPMEVLAARLLRSEPGRAMLASGVSHTELAVDEAGGAPVGLFLAMISQHRGMPVPVGGAGRLAEALVDCVREAGGAVATSRRVVDVAVERGRAVGVVTADGERFGARRAVLADVGPPRLFRDLVGAEHLPRAFLDGLRRFRYGAGLVKLDIALDGPVPWLVPELARCGVVHVTGDLETMARSAFAVRRGCLPDEPLLVVGQQSVGDPIRAPAGCHTLWVETRVPGRLGGDGWHGARGRFCEVVLERIEAHAPGFRDRVVDLASSTPPDLEAANANLVKGDIGGGAAAIDQQLVFRPVPGWFRYRTPVRGLYLCSASAHPGPGVHGLVGRACARRVLRDWLFSRRPNGETRQRTRATEGAW